jgi:hypothetical protein
VRPDEGQAYSFLARQNLKSRPSLQNLKRALRTNESLKIRLPVSAQQANLLAHMAVVAVLPLGAMTREMGPTQFMLGSHVLTEPDHLEAQRSFDIDVDDVTAGKEGKWLGTQGRGP